MLGVLAKDRLRRLLTRACGVGDNGHDGPHLLDKTGQTREKKWKESVNDIIRVKTCLETKGDEKAIDDIAPLHRIE